MASSIFGRTSFQFPFGGSLEPLRRDITFVRPRPDLERGIKFANQSVNLDSKRTQTQSPAGLVNSVFLTAAPSDSHDYSGVVNYSRHSSPTPSSVLRPDGRSLF